MPDEAPVTPENDAPLSAAEGEDIIAAEMADATADYAGTQKVDPVPAPVKEPAAKPAPNADRAAAAAPVAEPKPEDKKADEITAAAQAAIKSEQDKANAETVAAAARELKQQQEAEARKAAESSGKPAVIDAGAALKEIVDASDGLMIADVDDNGAPVQRSFKEWAGMYPGIAQAVAVMGAKLAEKVAEQRLGSIQSQLEPLVKAQQAQEHEKARGQVFDSLAKPEFGAHEDARQIVDSPEYAQAIAKAPDVIRECAQSWDPSLQKLALEWFKTKTGIKSDTVKKAEAAHKKATLTAAVGLRSAGKPTVKEGDELTDAEAKRLFDEAMAEGIKG